MATELVIAGTTEEQKAFLEVFRHYEMAQEDLDQRIKDFDKKDILFRSHIEETSWPYRSLVFDPRTFTALFEKTSRILANKPKGRLVPREGGDSLGAKINNELLNFQWDDNERVDNMPMIAKWQIMDMNARKYGASFGIAKWHYQRQKTTALGKDNKKETRWTTFYDGPNFKPLNNRDCLPNPSYSTIKNWFQHRDWLTLQDLETVNDTTRGKPIYKNLDILRDLLKKGQHKGGDTRSSSYSMKNKTIKGLTDYLGQDEVFKVVEVITEYREDRWVTFAPQHGLILRDIPNPYDHGQIPVVMLKYYPIDEDLYGLSEIEPVEKLQKALNAIVCQYLDAINMSLYAPLKVNQTGGAVQMHTLEFGPGKKWLMNNPQTDVLTHDQSITGVSEFTSTYRFLVSAMQEALGETSTGVSNLSPGEGDKTATEIRDLAVQRSARDNYNQIFLSEALKKQMIFWHKMNQQFLFSSPQEKFKVIRIVGKDAVTYFQEHGLSEEGLTEEATQSLILLAEENASKPPEEQIMISPQEMMQPIFPVEVNGEIVNKFVMDEDNQSGDLILEPQDLSGTYDYVPDIESMKIPDQAQMIAATKSAIELSLNPASTQLLAADGYRIKYKDLLEDFYENLGKKDADKYFEKLQPMVEGGMLNGQLNQAGAGVAQAGGAGVGNVQQQGLVGGNTPLPNGQANAVVPGPVAV